MLKEFKEFATRGNIFDMAIGIIIGGAFQKIVTSLVNDIVMPSISIVTGKVDFSNSVNLVKEDKQYKIDWSTTLIFPELKEGYKVRVKTLKANRGAILDRDGNKLAYDGKVSSVGIVPGKLGDNKDESISKISELTGVSIETINKYLSARLCKR